MSAACAETTTSGSAGIVASAPGLAIDAPCTGLTSSGPTTPTRSPSGGAGTVARFAVTVVCGALPQPAAVPAQSTDNAMRAALIRIPFKIDGAGRDGPPPCESTCRSDYLTVAGIPLTLPAFNSTNCAATAVLMDAGTFELHLP